MLQRTETGPLTDSKMKMFFRRLRVKTVALQKAEEEHSKLTRS